MNKYKGYLAFDFDSVIASYKRPFRYDKLGKPNKEVIEVMRYYYKRGYYILIFTGRQYTPKMEKWLKKYKVPYTGFNVQPKPLKLADNFKPMYDCLIDDKAINWHFVENKKSKQQLIEEINEVLRIGKIDKEK